MRGGLFVGLVLLASAVGVIVRARRERQRREDSDVQYHVLTAWALSNGWRAYEGIDIHYAAIAERLTGLAGLPPGFRGAPGGEPGGYPAFVASHKWVFGAILAHDTPEGEIVVVDCWPEGDSSHHVFAGLSSQLDFCEYSMDVMPGLDVRTEGEQPYIDARVNLLSTLSDLALPARVRFIGTWIVLYSATELSAPLADEMGRHLSEIARALPRRLGPGTG